MKVTKWKSPRAALRVFSKSYVFSSQSCKHKTNECDSFDYAAITRLRPYSDISSNCAREGIERHCGVRAIGLAVQYYRGSLPLFPSVIALSGFSLIPN